MRVFLHEVLVHVFVGGPELVDIGLVSSSPWQLYY